MGGESLSIEHDFSNHRRGNGIGLALASIVAATSSIHTFNIYAIAYHGAIQFTSIGRLGSYSWAQSLREGGGVGD